MDTEQGQMMAFLWDMLEEGEYADAATLAKQMLQDNPNNIEAISVLAIVYERMADASRDGGDESSEKEFLKNSLSQYLKLLSVNPDSVADKIKADKIRKRLNGETGLELSQDIIKKKIELFLAKIKDFYDKKIAPYMTKKWVKVSVIVLPIIILVLIGFAIYNNVKHNAENIVKSPITNEFSDNLNDNYQNNINTYNGPTDTIYIENDNAKIEREEKELEEQYNRQISEQNKSLTPNNPVNGTGVQNGYSRRMNQQENYIDYNKNQNINSNQGVKPFKLPFSNIEIKPGQTENTNVSQPKENEINSQNTGQNSEQKEQNTQNFESKQSKVKSQKMKRADALMDIAIRAHDSGNKQEAKQAAREAKELYREEISSGSSSRRARKNIETADTILND